jgi:hypothetical protein
MRAALLWILACASLVLLAYEAVTLIGLVLRPLLANPQALQTDFHYYYQAAGRFSTSRSVMLDDRRCDRELCVSAAGDLPFIWLSVAARHGAAGVTITSYWCCWHRCSNGSPSEAKRDDGRSQERHRSHAHSLRWAPPMAVFRQVNAFVLAAVAFVPGSAGIFEAAVLLALGSG